MDTVTIEPLDRARVDETARMLARAFDDSPLFEFLFPKGPARLKITAGTFRGTLLDALPFEQVHVATDATGVIGAACWLPPEGYPITPRRQAFILARIARLVPWAPTRLPDSMRYLAATDKVHPKDLHWYLSILGVDPRRQGEGLGGGSSTTSSNGSTAKASRPTSRPTRSGTWRGTPGAATSCARRCTPSAAARPSGPCGATPPDCPRAGGRERRGGSRSRRRERVRSATAGATRSAGAPKRLGNQASTSRVGSGSAEGRERSCPAYASTTWVGSGSAEGRERSCPAYASTTWVGSGSAEGRERSCPAYASTTWVGSGSAEGRERSCPAYASTTWVGSGSAEGRERSCPAYASTTAVTKRWSWRRLRHS